MVRQETDRVVNASIKQKRRKRRRGLILTAAQRQKRFEHRNTVLPADEFGVIDILKMSHEQKEFLTTVLLKNKRKMKAYENMPKIKSVCMLLIEPF
jgi:hypothetical protein